MPGLPLGGPRQRAALAMLSARRQPAQSARDRLIEQASGARPCQPRRRTPCRFSVRALRHGARARSAASPGGNGLPAVRVEPGELDLQRFVELVERARRCRALRPRRGSCAAGARALGRTAALADVADAPFAEGEAGQPGGGAARRNRRRRVEADLALRRHAETGRASSRRSRRSIATASGCAGCRCSGPLPVSADQADPLAAYRDATADARRRARRRCRARSSRDSEIAVLFATTLLLRRARPRRPGGVPARLPPPLRDAPSSVADLEDRRRASALLRRAGRATAHARRPGRTARAGRGSRVEDGRHAAGQLRPTARRSSTSRRSRGTETLVRLGDRHAAAACCQPSRTTSRSALLPP